MASFADQIATSGSIAGLLNSLVYSGTSINEASAEDPRAALVFTSRFRRNIFQRIKARQEIIADLREQHRSLDLSNPLTVSSNLTLPQHIWAQQQKIVDLQGQLRGLLPEITMALNPRSIEFDEPKRKSRQDTIGGTVFHHFTDDKGSSNDVLTINFQGNTGNIYWKGDDEEVRDRAIQRFRVWHNLYNLTREPALLSNGTANIFYISYVSPLFPITIIFEGIFDGVMKFMESADKPNSRDYSMTFIVQHTRPSLDVIASSIMEMLASASVATPSDESKNLTS